MCMMSRIPRTGVSYGGTQTVSSVADGPVAPAVKLPANQANGKPVTKTKVVGTLYRGREGMWSWVAHRITGVLTFFFLFAHVLDTALVRVSPDSYDKVIETYKNPFVNLMEVGLVGAVLYHALNGLRIIAVDFWSKGPRLQRQMLWIIVGVWVVVMVPGAFFMLKHTVETLTGSK
ncbi:succinate dehydrogenase subunit C [Jatrophihabitans sp. GAS493]|nr:succinate dehydrogenase subunit C [Jatrophihabitans sp. GAS493]